MNNFLKDFCLTMVTIKNLHFLVVTRVRGLTGFAMCAFFLKLHLGTIVLCVFLVLEKTNSMNFTKNLFFCYIFPFICQVYMFEPANKK